VISKEEEFVVVPQGVEHRSIADRETRVSLFELVETGTTGNTERERTASETERLGQGA
jgi:mannose-6-phosphate isomerase-like protein (cupin superfamily)